MPRIAYLGPEGTFTEVALLQMVAHEMVPGLQAAADDAKAGFTAVLTDSTPDALAAVRDGRADYACVPIENSIEGSVLPTLDSLAVGKPLQIYAELTLDVAFAIVTRPGHSGPVQTVAAFPVALAQVRQWLAANLPGASIVPATSNAAAAQEVAEGNADAGVSTRLAAERYGLEILAADVVDEANARTRLRWSPTAACAGRSTTTNPSPRSPTNPTTNSTRTTPMSSIPRSPTTIRTTTTQTTIRTNPSSKTTTARRHPASGWAPC